MTTKEKGDAFEEEVAALLRYMPEASSVQTHVKVGGKDVDIYLEMKQAFSRPSRVVIDTKDYKKPLTRGKVSAECASYYPLVAKRDADQFMLVTRNGIVTNAKECLDGSTSVHRTILELEDIIIGPSHLIDNMADQFDSEGLSQYYVKPMSFQMDLKRAAATYDLWFNDFITFCVSRHITDLAVAERLWSGGRSRPNPPIGYTSATFSSALEMRRRSSKTEDLELVISNWLGAPVDQFGIALLGTYGTGKSSFAKRIAYVAALESDSNRLCNATSLILLEKAPARIDHAADRLRDISLTLAM
jgi:hypothetical protein